MNDCPKIMRVSEDFEKKHVVKNPLPPERCEKCEHWIECEGKDYGWCTQHSDDEWDAFTYPDDCCTAFVELEDDEA